MSEFNAAGFASSMIVSLNIAFSGASQWGPEELASALIGHCNNGQLDPFHWPSRAIQAYCELVDQLADRYEWDESDEADFVWKTDRAIARKLGQNGWSEDHQEEIRLALNVTCRR